MAAEKTSIRVISNAFRNCIENNFVSSIYLFSIRFVKQNTRTDVNRFSKKIKKAFVMNAFCLVVMLNLVQHLTLENEIVKRHFGSAQCIGSGWQYWEITTSLHSS